MKDQIKVNLTRLKNLGVMPAKDICPISGGMSLATSESEMLVYTKFHSNIRKAEAAETGERHLKYV